jgi:hypothetical protein
MFSNNLAKQIAVLSRHMPHLQMQPQTVANPARSSRDAKVMVTPAQLLDQSALIHRKDCLPQKLYAQA